MRVVPLEDDRCDCLDKRGSQSRGVGILTRRSLLGPRSLCFAMRGSEETFRGGQVVDGVGMESAGKG